MPEHSPIAVIRAEPDGYDIGRENLMGRQSAGHGFLRAAVAARGEQPILGYARAQSAAAGFAEIVRSIDPAAPFEWVNPDNVRRLSEAGVLYLGDPTLPKFARTRMRAGVAAYSLCGVTHTTASLAAMDSITDLVREAVTPWDALICTSTSVRETVQRVHEAESNYLAWRYGDGAQPPASAQLPVIPLGIHCDDFAFAPGTRARSRQALEIEDDEVVGLFVGRLVFHAKAHPFPIFESFQRAAVRTGRRLAMIFSGWFPNKDIEQAYRDGAAAFAPDVRMIFLDGRETVSRERAWSGADIFVSPSDNIQETFGLTPVEAMAAGLPVVVSDYDGYRDTVRDGVDGFRIRTWAPGAGLGQPLIRALETEAFSYNHYCWGAASMTAVDIAAYTDAIVALAESPDLRRRLGEAGARRARETYDWSVVYRQYQALWRDLNARRLSAIADPAMKAWFDRAPRSASSRLDPFHAFGHYPSATLTLEVRLAPTQGGSRERLRTALAHPLFGGLTVSHEAVERLFDALARGETSLEAAAGSAGLDRSGALRAAGLLLKMGMARVVQP